MDDKVIEVKEVVVHTFTLGDVDDPDIYAAGPIFDWQRSEMGQWVMAHAVEQPIWRKYMDYTSYGYSYAITARLTAKDYTFWVLKWQNNR